MRERQTEKCEREIEKLREGKRVTAQSRREIVRHRRREGGTRVVRE